MIVGYVRFKNGAKNSSLVWLYMKIELHIISETLTSMAVLVSSTRNVRGI